MLVVVEGPDGCGKTTLVETLRHTVGRYFWVLRPSRPPENRGQILQTLNWVYGRHPSIDVLFDRHPVIGETVYGPTIRGASKLADFNSPEGRKILLRPVTLIIYCRPITPVIEANVSKNYQMDGVRNNIANLVDGYDQLMDELSWSFPVVRYDYNKDDVNSIVEKVRTHDRRDASTDIQPPVGPGAEVQRDRDS